MTNAAILSILFWPAVGDANLDAPTHVDFINDAYNHVSHHAIHRQLQGGGFVGYTSCECEASSDLEVSRDTVVQLPQHHHACWRRASC